MPNKIFDVTGLRVGRLIVIGIHGRDVKSKQILWNCKCDCGNLKVALGANLRRGTTTSCGCYAYETQVALKTKHNSAISGKETAEYRAWSALRNRCTNINNKNYNNYGGRGITVCERWNKFENFLSDMGEKPSKSHSIDRINVNEGYNPENCRWATAMEQARNRRNKKSNKTGQPGVCWENHTKKWLATISKKLIGRYENIEDAIAARKEAELKYWGV